MKICKCEHWQSCPTCYPRGFDEQGNRKPVEIPPSRDELLARIAELEGAIERMRVAGGSVEFQMAFDQAKELLK